MSQEPLPKIESAALRDFADRAVAYCRLIERHVDVPGSDFLLKVHSVLPGLYAAGFSLPDTSILFRDDDTGEEDLGYEPAAAKPDAMDHEEWRRVYGAIQPLVGPRDSYREIFDPYEPDSEKEVIASLTDDFVDTYRDLRTGLAAWERGETGEALWEWRFRFECHWGEHVTGALRALHILCSTYDVAWPRADGGAA